MPDPRTTSDVIAITGHRIYPDRAGLYRGLNDLNAKEYVFGGANGVDSDALDYLARTQPRSSRTVIVPNRFIDQPVLAQRSIKENATKVIELKNTGYNRYQIRNQTMVDRSTHLRAFYDFRGRGGTFNTINYAKSTNKSYDVWPMSQYDEREILGKSNQQFNDWFKNMKAHKVKLSSIKGTVLKFLRQVRKIPMKDFLESMGYAGASTLESMWSK